MGNLMTVIKVHLGDGVSYYKSPICVMEILIDHPDYALVSMSKGKRIILSSDVNLRPGRNYYLVSPDNLFSVTKDSPEVPDHALSCCSHGYGKLYRVVAICASTKSLFATVIPKRKCSKTKSSSTVVIRNSGAGQQPGRKRALIISDNCTDVSKLVTSLAPDAPAPAGAVTVINESSILQYEGPEVWKAAVRCSSPEVLPLGHGMVAKVEERCSIKRPRSPFNIANTNSESDKERSSCVPWKSLKRLDEGEIVSQALRSKDKWLEDMIRGADNQWNRKKQQGFTMQPESEYSKELQSCSEPNLWNWCLPLGRTVLTSAPKKDGYLDYSQTLTPGSSGRSQSDSFTMVAVDHDRMDPQQDFQGACATTVARTALQSEIKETKRLEWDETVDVDRRHPLWLKMDEMERQYLMTLTPPVTQKSLQRFSGNDASTRLGSLKFSSVDRG